jgi:hypothetical protein
MQLAFLDEFTCRYIKNFGAPIFELDSPTTGSVGRTDLNEKVSPKYDEEETTTTK